MENNLIKKEEKVRLSIIETIKTLHIPETSRQLRSIAQFLEDNQTHRIWLIGNGGSHHTASHFASDLSALGFDTMCLTDSPSRITAITNDFGWKDVYTIQMIHGHFKKGDILFVASVHGGIKRTQDRGIWSNNLILAIQLAKGYPPYESPSQNNNKVIAFLGFDGGIIKGLVDYPIIVSSKTSGIVEGIHSLLTHIIIELIKQIREENLKKNE